MRNSIHASVALIIPMILLADAQPAAAQTLSPADAIAKFDKDHDGSLSLKETLRAARAHFRALDPDADGSLDAKEAAAAGISSDELAKADPDKDATLDEKEFLNIVTQRFKAADKDSDKSLDTAELSSPEGAAVLKLLQ